MSLYDSHGDVLVAVVRMLSTDEPNSADSACLPAHPPVGRVCPWVSRSQVHKPNSLEHLKAGRFGPRPTSAASTRSRATTASTRSRPGSAMPRMMTASSRSVATNASTKTRIQRLIDGDEGPAMIGVTTYPYTRSQKEYLDDFQSLVATTIDHPYMATTAFNRASVPHDLLYGSNFDDDRLGGIEKKWRSEYSHAYVKKDHVWAKKRESSGVRSEVYLG